MSPQEPIKIDFLKEKNLEKLNGLIVDLLKENEALKKRIIELTKTNSLNPGFPSSMKPHFAKADTKKKHKKSGAKKGHVGHSKTKVVETENLPSQEHKLESCPDCGKGVTESIKAYRKRYIIDIDFLREAETTVHNIHRHWCPYCKGMKEPIVTAALPGCNYGINTTI